MIIQRHATFLRFLVAGGFNTLFGWILYVLAIVLGAQPWLALIISTGIGIAFNFFSLGAYAFRDLALRRLPRFVLSYGLIYAINLLSLSLVKHWLANPIWAQLLLTPPMAILSYLLMSRTVFTGKEEAMVKAQAEHG